MADFRAFLGAPWMVFDYSLKFPGRTSTLYICVCCFSDSWQFFGSINKIPIQMHCVMFSNTISVSQVHNSTFRYFKRKMVHLYLLLVPLLLRDFTTMRKPPSWEDGLRVRGFGPSVLSFQTPAMSCGGNTLLKDRVGGTLSNDLLDVQTQMCFHCCVFYDSLSCSPLLIICYISHFGAKFSCKESTAGSEDLFWLTLITTEI